MKYQENVCILRIILSGNPSKTASFDKSISRLVIPHLLAIAYD